MTWLPLFNAGIGLGPRFGIRKVLRERVLHEQFIFTEDEPLTGKVCNVKARGQDDGVRWARLFAPAAINATQHVDLVAKAVALAWRHRVRRIVLSADDGNGI